MIPSLVARELREAIVEYLATTFALTDDEAYAALSEFLLDDVDGIFRGPYLRVRLPFVEASDGSDTGLGWVPPGFQPYVHQLLAWRRLAGRNGSPKSTLITTGTGSGKSEAFLMPIVDHCRWARQQGQHGIKALILYPMNALVVDQERRIAELLSAPELQAAGVTGGVWIGDDGTGSSHSKMSAEHLINDRAALLANPPDILLTNYKMLDRLLTNESRQALWGHNTRPKADEEWNQPLRYLVLDEFHTYDGAQGTDVAMLLRRLGHRLGIATNASPLSQVACVGTSATLGSAGTAMADMRTFAERVFGQSFDESAVIGEQRRTVDEVCPELDLAMPLPDPVSLFMLDPTDADALALAFTGELFDDPQLVGDRLLRHSLTARLLNIASATPRSWDDVVLTLAARTPEWAQAAADDPDLVAAALQRFVGLLSTARGRTSSGKIRPLFSIEVQVWIREVTRLSRSIQRSARFNWADTASSDPNGALELPAIYCTQCGRSGWLGVANRAAGMGDLAIERLDPMTSTDPYVVALRERERSRTLMSASPGEPDVLWLDPEDGQVRFTDPQNSRIPVLVGGMTGDDKTADARDEAAKHQQCPSCGSRDAIRFLGSRVTTLASVGITQMFGSSAVADDERKLLAFTDSVQDASHRAAFFSGRVHRFNLRATLSGALQTKGRVPLGDVASTVLTVADLESKPADAVFSLIPPDLVWEDWLSDAWVHHGSPKADSARAAIEARLSFDAVLEAGLRSRLGRTLETTGTAVAEVLVGDDEWDRLDQFVAESVRVNAGQLFVDSTAVRPWVHGVIERVRQRGGIFHKFLDRYVATNGKRWEIWGGADPIAPKFPKGISAPSFLTDVPSDEFDPIKGKQTWMMLWTCKLLGLDGLNAEVVLRDLLNELTAIGVFERRQSDKGSVWGIPLSRIEFVDVTPIEEEHPPTELRCTVCSHRFYATPVRFADWLGRPCMRVRCPGTLAAAPVRSTNYYRRLYRSGKIRRVVATEHTGLLTQRQRERIEEGFKRGERPDAPNVLTSTPTLEMGIDIGDLSAVMLTAVPPTPANYVQRVGRAGRHTGNALVTTFAEADPRSQYFMQDPEQMIAGEITAPACFLDAIEILRRQYLAFLIDQAARRGAGLLPGIGEMPFKIGKLATTGVEPDGWMTKLIELGGNTDVIAEFVALFGTHLDTKVALRLARWAENDLGAHVLSRLNRWGEQITDLKRQRDRLRDREKELKELVNPSEENKANLGRVVAELRYVAGRITSAQGRDTLGALEAIGLMPNYTLFDDTVTLEVNLWQTNNKYDPANEGSRRFETLNTEYQRAASVAIRELAPGNYFYVNAHKVRIDALDTGTENEPTHSPWRLCPSCAWATRDIAAPLAKCVRCGSTHIADHGQLVTVLPLQVVSSTEREETSRVADDSEERDREFHEVRTFVDIDPIDIEPGSALLHTGDVTFGVEAARSATIRYLNFGLHASKVGVNHQMMVNGRDVAANLFRTCRHCGSVFGIKGDTRDENDPNHHRTWCKVRSGARKERWDHLVLSHELVTEAVRILLPIGDFESTERTQSFKAALMLGLRDSFGGDPSHLRIIETDFPAANDPESRVRYVVVHDSVPGGTGYLLRLADPARLERILRRARLLIATCACQTRGRTGCHKCLYNSVGRREIPLVSRQQALSILDEILADWALEPAPNNTITGINLSKVRQSELERMFKVLLHRWSEAAGATLATSPDPTNPRFTRFSVRFISGAEWIIREQVTLMQHHTIPDFYAERVDRPGTPPVAIYLDGWEFHGAEPTDTDDDAVKRLSVRASGTRVWTLTYDDVDTALKATNTGAATAPVAPLPSPIRYQIGQKLGLLLADGPPINRVIDLGAVDQLMLALAHPDSSAWRMVAEVVLTLASQNTPPIWVSDTASAADAIAINAELVAAPDERDVAVAAWTSLHGLEAATIIDRSNGFNVITAVLSLDTAKPSDRLRWADWHHLSNIAQHLDGSAIITTTKTHVPGNITLPLTPPIQASGAEIDLSDIFDSIALGLAQAAVDAGFVNIIIGDSAGDANDTPIEAQWPDAKVAIVAVGLGPPVLGDGWVVRTADAWTIDTLLAALQQGTPNA